MVDSDQQPFAGKRGMVIHIALTAHVDVRHRQREKTDADQHDAGQSTQHRPPGPLSEFSRGRTGQQKSRQSAEPENQHDQRAARHATTGPGNRNGAVNEAAGQCAPDKSSAQRTRRCRYRQYMTRKRRQPTPYQRAAFFKITETSKIEQQVQAESDYQETGQDAKYRQADLDASYLGQDNAQSTGNDTKQDIEQHPAAVIGQSS